MTSKQLLSACTALFAASIVLAAPFERQELVLMNVTSSTAQAQTTQPLYKGESGLIIRDFGANEMIIVSKAIVNDANTTHATFAFAPYNGTVQPSLPTFKSSPQNGDKLVIHPFGKRSLILAPNFEMYQRTANLLAVADTIHPDHFATYLLSHYNPTPTKEDMQKFCENYSIEFLYITSTNGTTTLRDCGSFALLGKPEITPSTRGTMSTEILPFYHRVGEIKRGLFDFGPKSIEKYDSYYEKLFGDKK